ncbi:MAG TPA: glycosyltransferase family 2 protein [Candidatus Saccharimonadales bacterium]|jgi:glycosyltransferase involved in cell wall biosynthesis|nr:glycosyltransferase family 2 protein [Candidatus Saccharimonadales bacterium]
MKVFVQVPCLNEEKTLPLVLASIPKKIPGVDSLEILIIDDGSTDKTIEVAKKFGVQHFVRHTRNRGLARSFRDGVEYALSHGADIVINTDGDNQYPQDRIGDLVRPIIEGQADIVIADRQTHKVEHFSATKKLLQKIGTKIVNMAADTDVSDAASGFRAYSREALLSLNIVTKFSYTMETIIQAGNKRLAITSVPVDINPKLRESRLFNSMWGHVFQSGLAIARAATMYRPYIVFNTLGVTLLIIGLFPFLRYLSLSVAHVHGNHLQSLIVGAILLIGSFLSFVLGVVADLIRVNRILHEESLEHIKRLRFK